MLMTPNLFSLSNIFSPQIDFNSKSVVDSAED